MCCLTDWSAVPPGGTVLFNGTSYNKHERLHQSIKHCVPGVLTMSWNIAGRFMVRSKNRCREAVLTNDLSHDCNSETNKRAIKRNSTQGMHALHTPRHVYFTAIAGKALWFSVRLLQPHCILTQIRSFCLTNRPMPHGRVQAAARTSGSRGPTCMSSGLA